MNVATEYKIIRFLKSEGKKKSASISEVLSRSELHRSPYQSEGGSRRKSKNGWLAHVSGIRILYEFLAVTFQSTNLPANTYSVLKGYY